MTGMEMSSDLLAFTMQRRLSLLCGIIVLYLGFHWGWFAACAIGFFGGWFAASPL